MNTSLFTIYSQRLAGYLMLNGIPLISMSKNKDTGKNDFLFPNTEELHTVMKKWKEEYNK